MSLNIGSSNDGKSISKQSENNRESSLGLALFKFMKKFKNKVLQYIADTDESDTYEQILRRGIRTALKLKEQGITRNDIISTCTSNHKNSCVPWIASQFLGAVTANFDQNLPSLDTIHLLKLVQPKVIFVSTEALPFIEQCLKEAQVKSELVVFGYSTKYSQFSEYLERGPGEEDFTPVPVADSKDTAVILFSSGSTGLPKGICLSHYSLLRHLNNDRMLLPQGSENVVLSFATFYWISAVWFFLRCVGRGEASVVCSKFNASNTWRIIEKYKVTATFLSPHLAKEFLNHRPKNVGVSSLKSLTTGSAPVTAKLMADLREALPNTKIIIGYGQTETTCLISMFNPNNPEDVDMQIRKPLSCGKIFPDFEWKIVDPDTEKILGPNEKGELRLKSDFLMNGYYKMDSSSEFDTDGYFKTGDVLYYDEDGCFYVVDRIKEMFKYKGWHILPNILEDILFRHPAVRDAAVVGIPHEIDGAHPIGVVVLRADYKHVTPKDIELFVEERVSEVQRLRAGIKITNEILRTATAKIKRSAMREMILNGEL